MKRNRLSFTPKLFSNNLMAVLLVTASTILMMLFGRNMLGEAVIAMLYLLSVAWSANRWGQLPGISAAIAAALAFDFLFIHLFIPSRLLDWKAGWSWQFSWQLLSWWWDGSRIV